MRCERNLSWNQLATFPVKGENLATEEKLDSHLCALGSCDN